MGVHTLAHVELYCEDLEASLEHFRDTMGMYVRHEEDDAYYMAAYGDWQDYTLILREGEDWGCKHVAWMLEDESDFEEYKDRIEASGYETEWVDEDEEPGQGRALRFDHPGETPEYYELVYDIDRAFDTASEENRSRLKNQPAQKPERGVGFRRIDHVNFNVSNVIEYSDWYQDVLDFNLREEGINPEGNQVAAWLSVSPLVHEIALVQSPPDGNVTDKIDHVAFYMDGGQAGELERAADLLRENDIEMVGGPARHGISQAHFNYYLEPSGNKVEIFAGGYLIFDPDWDPITWKPEDGSDGFVWWGGKAGSHARRQYDYVPTDETDWSEYGSEHHCRPLRERHQEKQEEQIEADD
ncbi:VOC family protein [Natronolimnohabitans sp. A-GB9]|uniref:VOC family protein n=1 Tax=Natronolimnohabitans sp. A-GB9 TaxID=3069757 RepID=UPI0027B766A5|nr:VOC family protein [Natronolimnohabitans sp. A-GB9]MDQ2052514.1 VOC family protein [Natronolimnohabitans sp. A-GB9]